MRIQRATLAALVAAALLTTFAPASEKPALEVPPTPSDVAAPPADAERTASGLAFKVLRPGTGATQDHPGPADKVTVHYAGWTTDGQLIASSYGKGKPLTIALNRVMTGWTEGLQMMVPGEVRRLWIPESLAYVGRPGKPAGMLVFDIELLSFEAAP